MIGLQTGEVPMPRRPGDDMVGYVISGHLCYECRSHAVIGEG